jgi:NAD(P)-dependent dehydrogenase (short-subunit alcohol dehydrogenase family)
MPALSAYQTSKAAMNQLTRGLAAELEGTGLTANAIHPGEVLTEMWDDIRREVAGSGSEGDGMRDWIRTLEELGGDPPQKAADLVLRLLAAEADGINGHFYFIEGGILGVLPTWSEPPPLPR